MLFTMWGLHLPIFATAESGVAEGESVINAKSLALYVGAILTTTILLWLVRPESEDKFLNGRKLVTVLKGLPLFGNALDFLPQNILNTLYTYPSRYGDHIIFYAMLQKCYSIANPTTAREILMKRPKYFCRQTLMEYATGRIGLLQSVFMARGVVWSQQRRNISPAFNHKNVREYEKDIHEVIRRWIGTLHAQNNAAAQDQPSVVHTTDMLREPFHMTVSVVNQVVFGVTPDHPTAAYFYSPQLIDDLLVQFRYVMETIFYPFPFWSIPFFPPLNTLEKQAVAAAERFKQNTMPIIQQKRHEALRSTTKESQNAMMTPTAAAVADNELKTSMIDHLIVRDHLSAENAAQLVENDEILANVRIIYFGGIDTTAVAISWICYHLAIYPAWLHLLRQEIEEALVRAATEAITNDATTNLSSTTKLEDNVWFHRLAAVNFDTLEAQLPFCQAFVKENMRCKGPVSGYIHNLETDIPSFVCSNGLTIEASKGFININLEGIHHHPEYYEDPWVFRPERWIEKDTPATQWLEKITVNQESSSRNRNSDSSSGSSNDGIAVTHCSTARQLQSMEESYMPFGAGPRICPGNKMSLVEQLIAVVYLVMFFDIELGCAKEEIQRTCSVTSPPNKMPILLTPRRKWH